jgi:hypothetical protein
MSRLRENSMAAANCAAAFEESMEAERWSMAPTCACGALADVQENRRRCSELRVRASRGMSCVRLSPSFFTQQPMI